MEHISDDDFIDKILELTTPRTPRVINMTITAYKALGNFSDEKVLLFLSEQLKSEKEYENYISSTIETLGNIQHPRAKEILYNYAKTFLENPLDLDALDNKITEAKSIEIFYGLYEYLGLVTALCKQGNQTFSQVIPFLLNHPIGEGDHYEYVEIKMRCISGLNHIYLDNIISVILETLRKNYHGWKSHAILGLQYLGSKKAIDALIQLLDHPDQEIKEAAYLSIKLIIGAYPNNIGHVEDTSGGEVNEWWSKIKDNYKHNIVYRNGVPRNLPQLVDLLLGQKEHPYSVFDEIMVTYGLDLKLMSSTSLLDQTNLISKLKMLSADSNFKAGVLYKFGHEVFFK